MKLLFINLFLALLSTLARAASINGGRTLVVYDQRQNDIENYSDYLDSLKGHQLTVDVIEISDKSVNVELFDAGEKKYDHLIVFPATTKSLNKRLSMNHLLNFYENGGNIMTLYSPKSATEAIRLFWAQLGVHLPAKGYTTVDNFQDESQALRLPLVSGNKEVYQSTSAEEVIFGESTTALLEGNELVIPVIPAGRKSYVINAKDDIWSTGPQGFSVVGHQNYKNARSLWIGSSDAFLNENFDTNAKFLNEITRWVFGEKAVIKTSKVSHSHVNGLTYDEKPYKVTDEIVYEISFSEWNGEKWVPFEREDIQFELRQVDPYYRITMEPINRTNDSIIYTTGVFKLPDRHGMFTFLTDYKRPGLSFVHESDVRAIRHLANDEYPRSWTISNSWVYLSAIYGTMLVWIAFVVLFVVSSKKDTTVSVEKKTE